MARSRLPLRFADVLCLDFVNTADYHTTDRPVEYLVDAGVLVDWAVDAGAVDAELAAGVHVWVARHPERAAAQLAGLLARREALYRVLLARLPSRGWPPATCSPAATWSGSASATTPSAAGCSLTPARTTPGAGAAWRCAATPPRAAATRPASERPAAAEGQSWIGSTVTPRLVSQAW